jgi:hypothetical protein
MRQKRKKVWIDRFQTNLSIRMAVYFLLYQAGVWALFGISDRMNVTNEVAGWSDSPYIRLVPLVAIGFALVFIYDAVKATHRIVGPLYRFRKTIQAITSGENVSLVELRKGDHLQELKEDFNTMLQALEQRGAITLDPATDRQPVEV